MHPAPKPLSDRLNEQGGNPGTSPNGPLPWLAAHPPAIPPNPAMKAQFGGFGISDSIPPVWEPEPDPPPPPPPSNGSPPSRFPLSRSPTIGRPPPPEPPPRPGSPPPNSGSGS